MIIFVGDLAAVLASPRRFPGPLAPTDIALRANPRTRPQRHAKNQNHIISKSIVIEAERTSCGLSLEELKGIRQRVRLRKPQRVTLHSWAFAQLGDFIVYKARRAGVPVVFVNPAFTSQQCCECGHIDNKNRVDQALFICRNCGVDRTTLAADRSRAHGP